MAVVDSDFADAERELVGDIIDGVDGVRLVVALVDLDDPHSRGVIDGRELIALDLLALFFLKVRNLTSIWM